MSDGANKVNLKDNVTAYFSSQLFLTSSQSARKYFMIQQRERREGDIGSSKYLYLWLRVQLQLFQRHKSRKIMSTLLELREDGSVPGKEKNAFHNFHTFPRGV